MATMKKTPFVRHPWAILAVGLPDDVTKECEAAAIPLPVLRATLAEAPEKIAAMRPLVVVVAGDPDAADLAAVRARAAEVAARMLGLEGARGPALTKKVQAAIHDAEAIRVR